MRKINLWSGPRNVSTALMYSFSQRSDTQVVDEPFYAYYLDKSGVKHPGRTEVLNHQPTEPQQILDNLLNGSIDKNLLFIKNMAHHVTPLGKGINQLLEKFEHVFLIRDPADMLPSLAETLPNPTFRDTAYQQEYELFERVCNMSLPLHVIDARELLKNPLFVLSELCRRLGIEFDENMLSWEKGPIPEDGIWAEHWYHNVHNSTGFEKYVPKHKPMPEHLEGLYEQCYPIYEKLFAHAIKSE